MNSTELSRVMSGFEFSDSALSNNSGSDDPDADMEQIFPKRRLDLDLSKGNTRGKQSFYRPGTSRKENHE